MPLFTPFTVRQVSDAAVTIEIDLKTKASAVDLLVSPHYIKVNQTPYYVDIDLWGEIDSGAATVRIDSVNKRICITAKRVTKEAWPQVLATGTKSELAARRAESVERQRTADAARKRRAIEEQAALKQKSLHDQGEVDAQKRAHLAGLQAREKTAAEAAVLAHFGIASGRSDESAGASSASPLAADSNSHLAIRDASAAATTAAVRAAPLPFPASAPPPIPVRSRINVPVAFTERVFPTPLRESRRTEEADWIARNAVHLQDGRNASDRFVALDAVDRTWQLLDSGDTKSASNVLARGLAAEPTNCALLCMSALSALAAGEPEPAIEFCRGALKFGARVPITEAAETAVASREQHHVSGVALAEALLPMIAAAAIVQRTPPGSGNADAWIDQLTQLGFAADSIDTDLSQHLRCLGDARAHKLSIDANAAQGDAKQSLHAYRSTFREVIESVSATSADHGVNDGQEINAGEEESAATAAATTAVTAATLSLPPDALLNAYTRTDPGAILNAAALTYRIGEDDASCELLAALAVALLESRSWPRLDSLQKGPREKWLGLITLWPVRNSARWEQLRTKAVAQRAAAAQRLAVGLSSK